MTVKGLKVVWTDGEVTCLVQVEVHAPLKLLLDENVIPMESRRLDPAAFGALSVPAEQGPEMHALTLSNLDPAHFGRPGIIVARNSLQACQFLTSQWVPQGNGPLDGAVRAVQASGDTSHQCYDALVPFLETEPESWLLDTDKSDAPTVAVPRCKFDDGYRAIGRGSTRVFLPTRKCRSRGPRAGAAAVIRERHRQVHQHSLQAWDLLLPSGPLERGRVRACFDGQWTEGPLRQLDPMIHQAFDRDGRLVELAEGDATIFTAWVARVLVKVPHRWSRLVAEVPDVARRLPAAWLVDSRCPLQFDRDVALVERPTEAAAILSRVTRNFFLPDGESSPILPAIRAHAGSWLALCTPSTWR